MMRRTRTISRWVIRFSYSNVKDNRVVFWKPVTSGLGSPSSTAPRNRRTPIWQEAPAVEKAVWRNCRIALFGYLSEKYTFHHQSLISFGNKMMPNNVPQRCRIHTFESRSGMPPATRSSQRSNNSIGRGDRHPASVRSTTPRSGNRRFFTVPYRKGGTVLASAFSFE
jgi:hypothetical protein